MKKPKVVAFLARAGHGKTTAARHLVTQHNARIVSFAGPLKRLAKRLLPLTDEQLYGATEVKEAVDPRFGFSSGEFMQRLGEGARQEIRQLVWYDGAINEIHQLFNASDDKDNMLFVIDDMRYINEAEAFYNDDTINSRVIKLTCPDAVSNRDPNHPSEAQVELVPPKFIDHTIISKKSTDSTDLKEKVDAVFATLFPPTHSKEELFKTHKID